MTALRQHLLQPKCGMPYKVAARPNLHWCCRKPLTAKGNNMVTAQMNSPRFNYQPTPTYPVKLDDFRVGTQKKYAGSFSGKSKAPLLYAALALAVIAGLGYVGYEYSSNEPAYVAAPASPKAATTLGTSSTPAPVSAPAAATAAEPAIASPATPAASNEPVIPAKSAVTVKTAPAPVKKSAPAPITPPVSAIVPQVEPVPAPPAPIIQEPPVIPAPAPIPPTEPTPAPAQ